MLERADVSGVEYSFMFPEAFEVSLESESIKGLALSELRTNALPDVSIAYKALTNILTVLPYVRMQDSRRKADLSFFKDRIILEVSFTYDLSRAEYDSEYKERARNLTEQELRDVSNDSNLIIGMLIGKLGLKVGDVKTVVEYRFRKDRIFERGFEDHFNQSFLVKLNIKGVSEIKLRIEDVLLGSESSIDYDFARGEKRDVVVVSSKFKTLVPISIDTQLNESIKKVNEILESVGAKA